MQVSHHPAISAAHAEGMNWAWWQTLVSTPKTSWSGTVEATPELPVRVRLGKEDYCWNRVSWRYTTRNLLHWTCGNWNNPAKLWTITSLRGELQNSICIKKMNRLIIFQKIDFRDISRIFLRGRSLQILRDNFDQALWDGSFNNGICTKF